MDLAYFENESENNEFKMKMNDIFANEITNTLVWWTGGTDLGNNQTFYWMGSGIDISYSDYMKYNPSHFTKAGIPENCLAIHSTMFKWNDECCDKENFFICRRDKFY